MYASVYAQNAALFCLKCVLEPFSNGLRRKMLREVSMSLYTPFIMSDLNYAFLVDKGTIH